MNHSGDIFRHRLIDLFVDANDTPYDFRTVAEEKCFGHGLAGAPKQILAERDDHLAGAAIVCGKFLRLIAVARRWRRLGVGTELLDRASDHVRRAGETRLVVAGEAGNYFVPGALEGDESSIAFFDRHSFRRSGTATHLTADLRERHWELPSSADFTVERASDSAREEIESFIERSFGQLWRFEVSHAFTESRPPLFIGRSHGRIAGFSAHDVNNRGLGFYGPAGVGRDHRGEGIGAALLRASLSDLADRGYQRTVIPWVSSVEFYRKIARAEPAQRFVTFEKEL